MHKGFVFALDNTLLDNTHDYSEPILEATKLIIDALGYRAPPVAEITNMIQETDLSLRNQIDPNTGAHYGDTKRRFLDSLPEVYRSICKKFDWSVIEEIEKELLEIGLRAFDEDRYRRGIKRGAIELLRYLADEKDGIAILTSGDLEVQKKKIDSLFKECRERGCKTDQIQVRVVDNAKSASDFSEIKQSMPECEIWFAIGNDYQNDIAPALEVGFTGLWIPVEAWGSIGRIAEDESKMNKSCCTKFDGLDKILAIYDVLS